MTERVVSARLDLEVTDPTTLELQIAVAPLPGADVVDTLSITVDGEPATIAPATTLPLAQLHYLA